MISLVVLTLVLIAATTILRAQGFVPTFLNPLPACIASQQGAQGTICMDNYQEAVNAGIAPFTNQTTMVYGGNGCFYGLNGGLNNYSLLGANNQPYTGSFTIPSYPEIFMTTSSNNATCGQSNGTITATPSGGSSFGFTVSILQGNITLSSNSPVAPGATVTFSNLAAGTYTVMATDGGCSCHKDNTVVVQSPSFIVTATSTTSSCVAPNCNGSITLNMNGGIAPYSIDWTSSGLADATTGSSPYTINGVCPGTYSATVTDANGCNTQITATVALEGADVYVGGIGIASNIITGTINWSPASFGGQTTIVVDADVLVQPGAVFNIVGLTVLVTPGHAIRGISSGAQYATIYSEGSVFDAACGSTWRGFEIMASCGISLSHSVLKLNNSVVTHAEAGVRNFKPQYPTATGGTGHGGYISGKNSAFIDNVIDVDLRNDASDQGDSFNNSSSFTNCQFILNAIPTLIETANYSVFSPNFGRVQLTHVARVDFVDCNIVNNNPLYSLNPSTSRITAFRSNLSSFNFFGSQTGTEASDPNTYTSGIRGFRTGFWVNSTFVNLGGCNDAVLPSIVVNISNSALQCYQSADVTNCVIITMVGNYLSEQPAGYSNNPNPNGGSNAFAWGSRIIGNGTASAPYLMYRNNFHRSTIAGMAIGLYVQGLGPKNNLVYGNSFKNFSPFLQGQDNVSAAAYFRYLNRGTPNSAETGLHCECNNFDSNARDIHINGTAATFADNGIARTQYQTFPGLPDPFNSAGNKFGNSPFGAVNFANDPAFNFNDDISCVNIAPIMEPNRYQYNEVELNNNGILELTSTIMNPINTSKNDCLPGLQEEPMVDLILNFNSSKEDYVLLQTEYDALVDGGDTEGLQSLVEISTFNDAITLFNTLLQQSPSLSEEVIIQAIEKEYDLPASLLTVILAANPSAAKNAHVKEALQQRTNPLSDAQWLQALSGEGTISVKELMETQLMYAHVKRDNYQRQAIFQMNQEEAGINEYNNVLQINEILADRYLKAQLLFTTGECAAGMELLTSTEQFIKLNKLEVQQHNDLINVMLIRCEAYSLDEPVLTASQKSILYNFWDTDPFGAGTTAASLLMELDGFTPIYPEENLEVRSMVLNDIKQKLITTRENTWLYPNPADKISMVNLKSFSGAIKEIQISNSLGARLMTIPLSSTDLEKVIPLEDVEAGNYFVSLVKKDGSIAKVSGLIIQH